MEERVLVALRDKLMRRDLFEDFCREYVHELNRLRMEHRASLTHGRAELASVEREIRKLIQAIKDGVSALSIKDELLFVSGSPAFTLPITRMSEIDPKISRTQPVQSASIPDQPVHDGAARVVTWSP